MFSPLSFNYFYVWLLYPLTLALHLGLEAPRGSASRRVLLGSVAGSLGLAGALAGLESRTAAGYGNSFFAGAILLVGLGWRLGVEPGADSPIQVGVRPPDAGSTVSSAGRSPLPGGGRGCGRRLAERGPNGPIPRAEGRAALTPTLSQGRGSQKAAFDDPRMTVDQPRRIP